MSGGRYVVARLKGEDGHNQIEVRSLLKEIPTPKRLKRRKQNASLAKKEIQYRKTVARTSVLILAPWNPLSLCAYGESHKE